LDNKEVFGIAGNCTLVGVRLLRFVCQLRFTNETDFKPDGATVKVAPIKPSSVSVLTLTLTFNFKLEL
jgi:hypothetical protein